MYHRKLPLLSILIPLYNEEEFVGHLLDRVLNAPYPEGVDIEIVIVDDCSRDASVEIVRNLAAKHPGKIRLIQHQQNTGKGGAIHTAIAAATGDYCLIQDADLEYDPKDYPRLLRPLLDGRADAVFGSRFLTSEERRVLYFWHAQANFVLTLMANVVADLNLTDMETCYKVVRTPLLKSIPLRNKRFGLEPELTIKLAQRAARIYEVPISYNGRTYAEGKKIGLKDAFEAVWTIGKFALWKDIYTHSGGQTLDALTAAPRFNSWMAETVKPYLGETVLEIGAGIGNLTQTLAPKRRRYIATDIDEEHLARLSNRFSHRPTLEVRRCDLANTRDFQGLEHSVDTVVCLNVLEHVKDDIAGLKNIHASLKPGGRAVILVPHDQKIFGTLDTALGHFRRYSHGELTERLRNNGFEVERILEFNRISRYPWWITGQVFKSKDLSGFQMKVFDRFVWLWRKLDNVLPWPPVSIIAIAKKA
ncbi:MAG: glycosyltransferase [Bryobacterales bacterium]|nr:glycosyltransferase [Bryobacterales bacterium]